jgi:hypothetical protein
MIKIWRWSAICSGVVCFRFWPPGGQTNLRIRLDRNLVCELLLPSGTYVQSFGSIAPAVTKRTLLTDDDDGRHVIVYWLTLPAEVKAVTAWQMLALYMKRWEFTLLIRREESAEPGPWIVAWILLKSPYPARIKGVTRGARVPSFAKKMTRSRESSTILFAIFRSM